MEAERLHDDHAEEDRRLSRGGAPVAVDLTVDDPSDRARVLYVPTPPDIADEMVKLAGISAGDVVYDPVAATHGSRLPRSTAEQAGVSALTSTRRRWPTLSRESKRQVSRTRSKSDWVMRWTFKILSTATVVFLYMGDHFNLLDPAHSLEAAQSGRTCGVTPVHDGRLEARQDGLGHQ